MAREVIMTNLGAINKDKLYADCKAASGLFAGISTRPKVDGLILVFETGTPDAEVEKVQAVVRAHDSTLKTPEQQVLSNIRTVALTAEGVALADLTTAQRNALMATLLWKAGGIAPDGTIRPLAEWVR